MSKINAVRLINLNYNNNAIRISDEVFHMKGQSTLFSLRNGGGKSVLVQMMTAPFVHKRYRDTKDRPFESYFTTNKPTFILVEWALDQGAGYVLTGMMVRRSQEIQEERTDNLEIITLISEYKEPCTTDIYHFPVVEKTKKEIVLKNFHACQQLFETYKKDHSMKFTCYDMGNSAQSRQYFDKLMEYQINYKEWETIIKKVNLKESGLSDLFADCRDERGLVEKWFLDAVESKLNKDKNRMKEFQTIIEKYVGQYKDNRSKIERRDTIKSFQEEAERIKKQAQTCEQANQAGNEIENRIAGFLEILGNLNVEAGLEKERLDKETEAIHQEMEYVEYEKISGEIHKLTDQERYHINNREMIAVERDSLEAECDRTERQIHLFACAKQQAAVEESRLEHMQARQRLEVSRKQEEDLEPERNGLGYTLQKYYEAKFLEVQKQEQLNREENSKTQQGLALERERIDLLEKQLLEKAAKEGALQANLQGFATREEQFNRRCGEEVNRNILGEYEPALLNILLEKYHKKAEAIERERIHLRRQLEDLGEKQKSVRRGLEDRKEERLKLLGEQNKTDQIIDRQEEELKERSVILRYLNLEEKDQFHMEKILSAAQRKLQETELARRKLEKEEDILHKDYSRLTQGRVLELPQEFEGMLEELGLHYVYGMDWLKKNGRSVSENQKLVQTHPFLPYALILSKQEVTKLSEHSGEVCTSFPIPIIVRETLEQTEGFKEQGIISFPSVSFYVLFNDNLLDEEKLRTLVLEKEEQIRRKKDAIAVRKQEYAEYFEKKEKIRNQKVTKESYEEALSKREKLIKELENLTLQIRQQMDELAQQEIQRTGLEQKIHSAEQEQESWKRKIEELEDFCKCYDKYLEQRNSYETLRKEILRLEEQKKLTNGSLEKLREKLRTLENRQRELQDEISRTQEQCVRYAGFEEQELQQGDIDELEARFLAITAGISQERKLLEEQLRLAAGRFEKAVEELEYLRKKYDMEPDAWSGILYSRQEEAHQEELFLARKRKKQEKDREWNEEDKKAAVVTGQIAECRKQMLIRCHQEEPLPGEAIHTQDFDGELARLAFEGKENQKRAGEIRQKIVHYESCLTALAEYSEFSKVSDIQWDVDFKEMTGKELRDFKGILARDYNQSVQKKREQKEALDQLLNRIVRQDIFQEDFYRKPLEAMLELTYDAGQVLAQLDTTIQSYEKLIEKLEVDISMIERERDKIVELLEDYIEEVHQNLGKIDANSTITVRDRSIKMLKLEIPAWEENLSLYQVRLRDFIEEVTEKGIALFEKNQNAQEYFGTRVSTKNLYDAVVGISNIQIRLYKVEEQREYPITWAEVAKNSGGEGFLSAFIILTSLLYYMRKDDSDLFADRNEGKVLVMDNPFAQTNAAHLLKPLMDMARKTNTQLICLSGLGGESIYNRFDNIYVLNLSPASLRNSMQYLKADHIRGMEEEVMIVSQVEVIEQQELIF